MVTRDRSTQAGFNSPPASCKASPITGGTAQINDSHGGLVTDGGAGANTLSLRGLGATRSLVLLNGRRVSPAGSQGAVGSVDLNVLPNAIVDRMEVLNSGASSIYGSDAIAGVVNVDYAQQDQRPDPRRFNPVPENRRWRQPPLFRLSAGTSGPNWSLQGSLEWYKRDLLRSAMCLRCAAAANSTPTVRADFIDPATGRIEVLPAR